MSKQRKIFLTFDDGIETGTSDVLDVLEDFGVRATFFLCGLSINRSLKRNKSSTQSSLYRIATNHLIANHSYTHCYGCYKEYYSDGLTSFSSEPLVPLDDFFRNEQYITGLLKEIGVISKPPRIARLPGRNIWCYIDNNNQNQFIKYTYDSIKAATALLKNNFSICGWDLEWKMSFDFAGITQQIKNTMYENRKFDEGLIDKIYPNYDMLSKEYFGFDRLLFGWRDMLNIIHQIERNELIILMHDRAFREFDYTIGFNNNYRSQLFNLIKSLKRLEYSFDVISDHSCFQLA